MIGNSSMKFVVLEGLKYNNKFYTMNTRIEDYEGFNILGYADTDEDARRILYPSEEIEQLEILKYINKMFS